MNFKQENINADVIGLKAYLSLPDSYIAWESKAIVTIEYVVDFETRSWGIKSLIAYATKVSGVIEYEVDHDDPSKRVGTIDINVTSASEDWKLESSIKPDLEGELLMVSQCDIDLENKVIYVS